MSNRYSSGPVVAAHRPGAGVDDQPAPGPDQGVAQSARGRLAGLRDVQCQLELVPGPLLVGHVHGPEQVGVARGQLRDRLPGRVESAHPEADRLAFQSSGRVLVGRLGGRVVDLGSEERSPRRCRRPGPRRSPGGGRRGRCGCRGRAARWRRAGRGRGRWPGRRWSRAAAWPRRGTPRGGPRRCCRPDGARAGSARG